MRRELGRFRGEERDTAGDGFFATFDGPARAIRAGQAIIAGLDGLGLEARIGVHVGECELHEGKLSGIAVNIGARIAARAGAARCWFRAQSGISWQALASRSRTAANNDSRASQEPGSSTQPAVKRQPRTSLCDQPPQRLMLDGREARPARRAVPHPADVLAQPSARTLYRNRCSMACGVRFSDLRPHRRR